MTLKTDCRRALQHLTFMASVTVGIFGCKTATKASTFKHTAGETVSAGFEALPGCKKPRPEPPSDDAKLADAPEAFQTYVINLMNHIMSRNPQAFGPLAPPDCFKISAKVSSELNAWARPGHTSIVILTRVFKESQNDAEVASIICHELAHLLRRHGTYASPYPPALDSDPIFLQAVPGGRQQVLQTLGQPTPPYGLSYLGGGVYGSMQVGAIRLLSAAEAADKSLGLPAEGGWVVVAKALWALAVDVGKQNVNEGGFAGRFAQIDGQIASLKGGQQASVETQARAYQYLLRNYHDRLLEWATILAAINDAGTRKFANDWLQVRSNWQEQEADEVGFELFVRAGFNPNHYLNQLSCHTIPNIDMQSFAVDKPSTPAPERGKLSHPTHCWRHDNIRRVELARHLQDYQSLLDNAKTVTAFEGVLDGLKQSLK